MQWNDMKDAPLRVEVLISLRWYDAPVVAWQGDSGYWYSSKGHLEDCHGMRDDFKSDEVEGWMPLPDPKWKIHKVSSNNQDESK